MIKLPQPFAVIDHQRLVVRKINEARHLCLEPFTVRLNLLVGHYAAHIGSSRRVADRARAAADKADWAVPGALEPRHRHQREEVPDMKAVRRRIEADIKRDLFFGKELPDLLLIRALRDISAFLQFIPYIPRHQYILLCVPNKRIRLLMNPVFVLLSSFAHTARHARRGGRRR